MCLNEINGSSTGGHSQAVESRLDDSIKGLIPPPPPLPPEPAETRFLKSILFGDDGLRAGWSIAVFLILTIIFTGVLAVLVSLVFHEPNKKTNELMPFSALIDEAVQFLGIFGAAAVCALFERRRILAYNLTGPARMRHFLTGSAAGFAALSLLVGSLYAGGYLRFGPVALSGLQIVQFGALWGIVFLLTGLTEEGGVRCYLQFTLTRGLNFWWALGLIVAMCLSCFLWIHNEGVWGVYAMAALGVIPCLMLQLAKSPASGFWQAAWVTSTLFGFIHTGNKGETWIGIFSAAAIGFVFCVSIRVTGSAWWAIGFHAAWDWTQTFFYGTADSGFAAHGHFLTTTPDGAILWSGGTDGPEGSLLVLPVILLVLAALVAIYGRRAPSNAALPVADQAAG